MFVMSQNAVITAVTGAVSSMLNGSTTPCTLNLFQNNFSPTPNSVLSDFTVATYTGYAPVTLTSSFGPIGWQTQGAAVSYSGESVFAPTGTTVGNVIYGYYLTDHSGNYLGAERFAQPVSLTGPTTLLHVIVPWGMSDGGIPGVYF